MEAILIFISVAFFVVVKGQFGEHVTSGESEKRYVGDPQPFDFTEKTFIGEYGMLTGSGTVVNRWRFQGDTEFHKITHDGRAYDHTSYQIIGNTIYFKALTTSTHSTTTQEPKGFEIAFRENGFTIYNYGIKPAYVGAPDPVLVMTKLN